MRNELRKNLVHLAGVAGLGSERVAELLDCDSERAKIIFGSARRDAAEHKGCAVLSSSGAADEAISLLWAERIAGE